MSNKPTLSELLIKLYWHGHYEGVLDGKHINGVPSIFDRGFTAEQAKQQLTQLIKDGIGPDSKGVSTNILIRNQLRQQIRARFKERGIDL